MRRTLPSFLLFSLLFSLFLSGTAFAADGSSSGSDAAQAQAGNLIPNADVTVNGGVFDCVRFMKTPKLRDYVVHNKPAVDILWRGTVDSDGNVGSDSNASASYSGSLLDLVMSCAIKSGRVPLWLMPYFLVRAIDYLLYLAGLISVLFVVIGGYHWIVGSYSEDKESGKKTIMHALLGLVISLVAYTAVNLLLYLLTS